jgi:hypothetical protein
VFLQIMFRSLLSLAVIGSAGQQSTPPPPSGTFQIGGILVDSLSSQPIARARVAIAPVTDRTNLITLITGEDGAFSFIGLGAGKYALTAQARGYLTQSFDQHDTFSTSIVPGPDFDTSHLVFRLPPAGSIAGIVTDEAGEPVRDTQVSLYFTGLAAGSDITRLQGTMRTDDLGAFYFGHLVPGHYLVAAITRPWYARYPASSFGVNDPGASLLDVAYPITFYGGAADATAPTPLLLEPGDKITANINLQPVRALRMHIWPVNAGPGRQTNVVLETILPDGTLLPVNPQLNSTRGQQELAGIPPGHYILTTLVTSGNIAPERVSSREVDFNANGETEGAAYVPVTAKLQFDPGARPSQAFLQLLNKKTRVVTSQSIGDAGEVFFKAGVPPGSYEVSVTNAPGVFLKSLSATGATVTGTTLEVRSGMPVNLTISAARGSGQITGVASRDGKRFAGAMILLVPADPSHNQVLFCRNQSASDGSFTLSNVVPGAYTLLALEHGWELAWMDPEVLKNYLGHGVAVKVKPSGKHEVKVDVQ